MSASGDRFIDIGANLLDDMFQGDYRGKKAHPPDLDAVIERAATAGVERIIVTAGSLQESVAALELIQSRRSGPVQLYTTVGVHPVRRAGSESTHPKRNNMSLNHARQGTTHD